MLPSTRPRDRIRLMIEGTCRYYVYVCVCVCVCVSAPEPEVVPASVDGYASMCVCWIRE